MFLLALLNIKEPHDLIEPGGKRLTDINDDILVKPLKDCLDPRIPVRLPTIKKESARYKVGPALLDLINIIIHIGCERLQHQLSLLLGIFLRLNQGKIIESVVSMSNEVANLLRITLVSHKLRLQVDFMSNNAKELECLILDPPRSITQGGLKKVKTLSQLLQVIGSN